jgi:voltage-gated potassium channel
LWLSPVATGCDRTGFDSVEVVRMDARTERMERRSAWPVLIAALLVVPVIALEETSYGEPWDTVAVVANWSIWLTFAAEMVAMLAVVPNRWRWIRQHPIDVLVVVLTPPVVPAGLQFLRLLRLLRLARVFTQVQRMFSPEGVLAASFFALYTVVVGGLTFAIVERDDTAIDGLYWAVTTVTTVGYGDVTVDTQAGRAIAVVVMLTGIGFVALLTGAIAQRFLAPQIKEVEQEVLLEEDALVAEIREIGQRLQRVEQALAQRPPANRQP